MAPASMLSTVKFPHHAWALTKFIEINCFSIMCVVVISSNLTYLQKYSLYQLHALLNAQYLLMRLVFFSWIIYIQIPHMCVLAIESLFILYEWTKKLKLLFCHKITIGSRIMVHWYSYSYSLFHKGESIKHVLNQFIINYSFITCKVLIFIKKTTENMAYVPYRLVKVWIYVCRMTAQASFLWKQYVFFFMNERILLSDYKFFSRNRTIVHWFLSHKPLYSYLLLFEQGWSAWK